MPISSDLVRCIKGDHSCNTWGDSGQGCLVICKYRSSTNGSMPGVCEVVRVRDDTVQLEGSSMRDVADIVR
jgi:hypothetical protein